MQIIVTSDTHGNENRLLNLILNNKDMDMLIHLGDGEIEFFRMQKQFPKIKMIMVKGNCDIDKKNQLPKTKLLCIDDFKIFLCHGDKFNVKYNLNELISTAKTLQANLVLFGHTHKQFLGSILNITTMNPGSLSFPRDSKAGFGMISINNKSISTNLFNL